MSDLATWLLAQYDADEQAADEFHDRRSCDLYSYDPTVCDCDYPDDVRADTEAKRRVVDEIFRYEAKIDGEWGCCHSADQIRRGLCPETPVGEIQALRLFALPYADMHGYDQAWEPEESG